MALCAENCLASTENLTSLVSAEWRLLLSFNVPGRDRLSLVDRAAILYTRRTCYTLARGITARCNANTVVLDHGRQQSFLLRLIRM